MNHGNSGAESLLEGRNLNENIEHEKLIEEIQKIQDEIHKIREQLGSRYMKSDVSFKEIMANMRKHNKNHDNYPNKRIRVSRTLHLMFYEVHMKMEVSKDQSIIVVLLPVPGKQTFGLNFLKNVDSDFYKLDRCCLPYSLNAKEEMLKANSLSPMQIIEYLEPIKTNIYAYYMRADQVQQLQMKIDTKKVDFYHSICYTHMELTFCVVDREEDGSQHRLTVLLLYSPLGIRPKYLNITARDNDISDENLRLLLQKCKSFKCSSLPEFYDAVNSAETPFKFL